MPVLIIMNKSYDDDQALCTVVNYVSQNGYGEYEGYAIQKEYAVEQMEFVKRVWGKDHGRRVRHFVLSFADSEVISCDQTMEVGARVCFYYAGYQSVYGLHLDARHLHLHFAVNTVSFIDGKMYAGGLSDWHGLRGYIQGLMPQWYVDLQISEGGKRKGPRTY